MKSKLLIIFILLVSGISFSQNVYLNFHPVMGLTSGEFKENVNDFGYGFDGSFLMSLGDSPFWAGIEASALFFDPDKLEFNTPTGKISGESIQGTIIGLLIFRTQISNDTFRPYFDAMLGFQHLFAESGGVTGPIYGIVEDGSTFETTEKDQVLCYGAGAGFMYHIYNFASSNEENAFKDLWFDLRLRYLYGGETSMITGYNHTDGNKVIFDTVKDRTNLLTFQLGISIGF